MEIGKPPIVDDALSQPQPAQSAHRGCHHDHHESKLEVMKPDFDRE
jgi:hypothetical protein